MSRIRLRSRRIDGKRRNGILRRSLMPMTGFSIEPGIYLPTEFGVRSEINVALTANAVEVTGAEPQRELVRVLAD